MKTILAFTVLSVFFSSSPDSERVVEKAKQIKAGQTLNLDFKFANEIKISTWNKQEVFVKATVNINDNKDNEDFYFEVNDANGVLEIASEIKEMKEKSKGNFNTDLNFEVKIPNNIKLDLNTISGDIVTTGFDKQMNLNTISGFIDITYPASGKANIKAKTISGEIYTNHEMDLGEEDTKHSIVGQKVDAKLNGGGEQIDLKTISGNIYLRK